MNFNNDSYLKIGNSHLLCQDYTLNYSDFIVVSDGCSGANFSDFGSKIICVNSFNNNHIFEEPYDYIETIISNSIDVVNDLNLNKDCLCATLLACKANEKENKFDVIVSGDGTVVSEDRQGNIHVYNYNYINNTPFYPLYSVYPELKGEYLSKVGSFCNLTYQKFDSKFTVLDSKEEELSVEDVVTLSFPFDHFLSVSLFSDGLNSFVKNKTSYDYNSVIKDIYNFKSYEGKFLSRRCKKQFDLFNNQEISNYDDFSMAMLRIKS